RVCLYGVLCVCVCVCVCVCADSGLCVRSQEDRRLLSLYCSVCLSVSLIRCVCTVPPRSVCVYRPPCRPRLKNIDRSSAQHLEVTVGDLTVIITDFKEKAKPTSTSSPSAASADHHSQSGSGADTTAERAASRSSSPRGEASSVNGESH